MLKFYTCLLQRVFEDLGLHSLTFFVKKEMLQQWIKGENEISVGVKFQLSPCIKWGVKLNSFLCSVSSDLELCEQRMNKCRMRFWSRLHHWSQMAYSCIDILLVNSLRVFLLLCKNYKIYKQINLKVQAQQMYCKINCGWEMIKSDFFMQLSTVLLLLCTHCYT